MSAGRPSVLVFTDLDGSLLGEEDYEPAEAAAALAALRSAGAIIVFCSAKTEAEQVEIRHRMGVTGPYIVENGGALHLEGRTIAFGVPYARVCAALDDAAGAAGVVVHGYASMTAREVAALTGLDPDDAERAKDRRYSETFVIEEGPPSAATALGAELEARGLRLERGSRFWTAQGDHDKGVAVRALLDLYEGRERPRAYGIGDGPNDAAMLAAVDVAMLVQRPDATWTDIAVPGVTKIEGVGPSGWAAAAASIGAEGAAPARGEAGTTTVGA